LLIDIACVLVIANKLLAVLSSGQSFDEFRPYPIHKRAVIASSYLADMILRDLVFIDGHFVDEHIPSTSAYLFVFVANLHKLFEVRVGLI